MYTMSGRWQTINSRTIEHDRNAQRTMGNTSSRFLRTSPFRRVFAGRDRQIFAIPGSRNCPIHQSVISNTKTKPNVCPDTEYPISKKQITVLLLIPMNTSVFRSARSKSNLFNAQMAARER